MIQSTEQSSIDLFKQSMIEFVTETFAEGGDKALDPQLTILAKSIRDNKMVYMPTVLDPRLLATPQGKEMLAKQVIPKLLQGLEQAGVVPLCIAWCMEAYMSQLELKKGEAMPDLSKIDTSKLPRKEVVALHLETAYSQDVHQWEIVRKDGKIHLVKEDLSGPFREIKGRFTNLFHKPIHQHKN